MYANTLKYKLMNITQPELKSSLCGFDVDMVIHLLIGYTFFKI